MIADIAPLEAGQATEPGAGLGALATSRGNLPLDSVDVRAGITGTSASMELTQGFRNPFDVALEATYIFPLPDRAAVTAMRMECAGHVVEAVLKERSRARDDYDQAIAEGRRAAIAEEDRPDVFTIRVGNIVPGERVTIRLTLIQLLPYSDGELTFRFPLVVAPRYIPGSPISGVPAGSGVAPDTDAVPDASRITPPVLLPGFPNPVQLTISVDVDPAGLPLTGLKCSLHATAEEGTADGHTIVRLRPDERPDERLDRDFILRLAIADHEDIATSLVLTQDAGADPAQGTFTLTLVPPGSAGQPRPRDVVLVLDRSGSMDGWKIVAARRAAARIIDTLTSADRFAVLCFDHEVSRPRDLLDGLAEATDRNRFRAVEELARTQARGGTEMLEPLDTAVRLLSGAGEPDRDRVLVLVTDGQIGNEDQILQAIGPLLSRIRVHVVGIDRAVNAGFLSRLASAGRGRCELVESEDRLDEAATRIHRRIGVPLVTGLALAPDGLRILPETVAPSLLPDLFPGTPVTVTGRWKGRADGTVRVRGTAADGTPYEDKVVARYPADDGNQVPTANWARAHLRDLEDRYACLADHDVAALGRLEQQITEVSVRYGVLCRFTAFVAVDSRVVTDANTPHRVTQPVELPAGWEPAGLGLPPAAAVPLTAAARLSHNVPLTATEELSIATSEHGPMRARRGTIGGREPMAAARREALRAPAARPLAARATGPAAQTAGDTPRLDQVRGQLADEAASLRAIGQVSDAERSRLLADLATRIDALLVWLTGGSAASRQLAELTELADRLRDCDKPGGPRGAELDTLWEETIRQLTAFGEWHTADRSQSAGPERERPAFWKRHG